MKLHHVNLQCRDILKTKTRLVNLYRFIEYGYLKQKSILRNENTVCVLRHKDVFLTIEERSDVVADSINDISFCVESVFGCCDRAQNINSTVLQQPYVYTCRSSHHKNYQQCQNCINSDNELSCIYSIEIAVLKSSVGNIKHTLLNKCNFQGKFLPGFVQTNFDTDTSCSAIQAIDHIALAVECGTTLKHITWYSDCLNLLRYKVKAEESKKGVVIRRQNGNGLSMLTLIEHPCSENVVEMLHEVEMKGDQVKIVFVESLTSDDENDQIQMFLRNHKGAGVQHVAFTSHSILQDAQNWLQYGVDFILPPLGYYNEIEQTLEKLKHRHSSEKIRQFGILIDTEKNRSEAGEGYLYQIFTKPIFDSKTFFFELIQRDNARGFGTGNITALWNALDIHFKSHENNVLEQS